MSSDAMFAVQPKASRAKPYPFCLTLCRHFHEPEFVEGFPSLSVDGITPFETNLPTQHLINTKGWVMHAGCIEELVVSRDPFYIYQSPLLPLLQQFPLLNLLSHVIVASSLRSRTESHGIHYLARLLKNLSTMVAVNVWTFCASLSYSKILRIFTIVVWLKIFSSSFGLW